MNPSPAEYVIEKLGGLTKTANALNRAVTTVQGWKERGRIPQGHWQSILEAAREADVKLELSDFIAAPVAANEAAPKQSGVAS